MCGIAASLGPESPSLAEAMSHALAHRSLSIAEWMRDNTIAPS